MWPLPAIRQMLRLSRPHPLVAITTGALNMYRIGVSPTSTASIVALFSSTQELLGLNPEPTFPPVNVVVVGAHVLTQPIFWFNASTRLISPSLLDNL